MSDPGEAATDLALANRRSLVRSSSAALVSNVSVLVLSLAYTTVTARLLGASGKGELFVASLSATTAALVAGLSLGPALQVLTSRRAVGVGAATRFAILYAIGFGFLGLTVVAAVARGSSTAIAAAAIMPAELLSITLSPLFVVTDQVPRRATVEVLGALALLIVTIALVVPASDRVMPAVVALAVTRWVIAIAFSVLLWRRPTDALETSWRRDALVFGLRQHGGAVLGRAAKRADAYLLAVFLDTAAVGRYSIASSLAELPLLVARALHPAMVSYTVRRGVAEASADVARTNRMLVASHAVALPIFGVAVALATVPVFGSEFRGAVVPFLVLLGSTFGLAIYLVLGGFIVGAGRPGTLTRVMAWPVLLNLALSLALIPLFGLVGDAIATAIGGLATAALAVRAAARIGGIRAADLVVPRAHDLAAIKERTLSRSPLRRRAEPSRPGTQTETP